MDAFVDDPYHKYDRHSYEPGDHAPVCEKANDWPRIYPTLFTHVFIRVAHAHSVPLNSLVLERQS